jgi:hypothetical protein
MHSKIGGLFGLAVVGLLVAGCSTPAETPGAPSPAPSVSESETPTEVESASHAFGEAVTLEFDGSVWEVTVQAPQDAPPRLSDLFPLEQSGTRYVTVAGSITRVSGEPVEPASELNVQAIVNGVFLDDEYLLDDEFRSLNAAPKMLAGGEAAFAQTFVVSEGDEVETVLVSLGMGEAAAIETFGEAVDLGGSDSAEGADALTPDVESMIYLWDQASPEQQEKSRSNWGLDGGTVTDAGIAQLIRESSEAGVILDEAEARSFLEWLITP